MSAIRARKTSAKEMSSIQVLFSLIHSRQVSSFFSGTTKRMGLGRIIPKLNYFKQHYKFMTI